jgi:hypothetical protein
MGASVSTLPCKGIAQKKKNAYRGKLAGVLVCGGKDISADLAFSSAKWNPRINRLPKCPRTRFLWAPAIMSFGNLAAIAGVEVVAEVTAKSNKRLTDVAILL